MSFAKGEVVVNYTHVWKDTNEHEAKQARDCLIAIADNAGRTYYLTLSTHNHTAWEYYQRFPEWNFLLTKKKCEGLTENSVVNLKLINAATPKGRFLFTVPEKIMKDIIRKFREWQESNPDPLYTEIKDLL